MNIEGFKQFGVTYMSALVGDYFYIVVTGHGYEKDKIYLA